MNRLFKFWQEVKRRNVHRSLAIYAGTSFIILEAADMIFPRLGLPDWTISLMLYLLILGAVITVVVSWIFEVTPGGVEITRPSNEVAGQEKKDVARGWKVTTYVSLAVILLLVIYNLAGILTRPDRGRLQSLVILPFDNFTGNDDLEYFVAGMHSSLIGDLGRISGLRVISKTSSNTYRNVEKPIPVIASELMVDGVVETTVTCVGDSICTQFKLFGALPEEKLLWSKSYSTDKEDILNLYSRVIRDIADEIELPLSIEQKESLDRERHVDPDAYELYLKGKFHMGFLTREDQEAAIEYFNKALSIDPGYAEAYAGIAGIWAVLKQMDYVSPGEADPEIHMYMAKALELNVDNDEILYFDGVIKVWTDFDWEGGEQSLKRCLEINPNFAEARAYYSHLMMMLKRPEEMREQMRMALTTDPKNPLIRVLAQVELMVELNCQACIEQSVELQQMLPNNPLLMLVLFICYAETGSHDRAIGELEKIFNQLADEEVISTLKSVYADQGFQQALIAATDDWTGRFENASAQYANMLYCYGGDQEKMFYWLDRMYIRRDPASPSLAVMPYLRPYSDHPRYVEILRQLDLPLGAFE